MDERERALWIVFSGYLVIGVLAVVGILLLGGCRVHVTVHHELRSPVRCRMDHKKKDLGFVCDHEPRQAPDLRPPPGERIGPL